jgi:hypothetical protein
MKNIYLILFITLAGFSISSCESNLNDLTSEEIADQIQGVWSVNETSGLYKSTLQGYTTYISTSEDDPTLIYIEGFYGLGDEVTATARISNKTIILSSGQNLSGGYQIITGTGTINDNLDEITLSYSIDDGSGELDNVSATYTFLY